MKILFLSNEQFLPLSGGGSVGNYKIVEKMVAAGHDVTVATPLYLGVEEARRIEVEKNIKLRPFSPYYIHMSITLRGPKYILYSILFTFHLLRLLLTDRYDVLFIRNCLLCFPAVLFKPFLKSLYAVSMTDFITGLLHEKRAYPAPVLNILFWFERFIPRFCELIFVVTPEMKRMLVKGGCQPSRIHVSYDGVDTGFFNPKALDDGEVGVIRERYGIEQKIVIFHGANVFTNEAALKKFLKIIDMVLEKADDITFVLIGHGRSYDDLKARLASDRVIFPGYVPHEEIPRHLAAADVGIIPYEHTFNTDIIITLKLLEYLAMGLPVVSTDLKSIRELFGSYDFVRLSDSTGEFVDDVIELAGAGRSDEAVELVRERYSWDRVTESILDVVDDKVRGR
jgi:glycosyltransferase involved in cell wall biosynthesis